MTELMDALKFTPDDLTANRAGTLGAGQRQNLERNGRRSLRLMVALVVAIVIGAALLLYAGSQSESPVTSIIGLSLTAVNAVILALGVSSHLRLREDLASARVSTEIGVIRRIVRVQNRIVTYVLSFEDGRAGGTPERLSVSKAVFNAFEDGGRYRLYRTTRTKLLVGAEAA